MSEEEIRNKANERRFVEEIWNKGNFTVLNDLVAPDYVDHDSSNSIGGPEGRSNADGGIAESMIS